MVASLYREHSVEWLEEHLRTIGGSNAGAVLGQSRFKKPWQVWDAMHGVIIEGKKPNPSRVSDDMRRGAILEPIARQLLAEYYGVPIENHDQHKFVYRKDMPWAHTLPDGWLATNPVELKVPRPGTVTRCNLRGLLQEWWIQGQHTLALTGKDLCYFGLMDPVTCAIHPFEVDRDNAFISRIMEHEAQFFDSIAAGKRPEEDEDEAIPADNDGLKILEGEQVRAIAKAWNSLKAISKETEESLEDAKAKLRELAGNADAFEVPGILKVYNRVCGGSDGKPCIDEAKLRELYPEAHADKRVWGKTGGKKASRRFMAYNLETRNAI